MLAIAKFLLLCTFLAPQVQGQIIILHEPREYVLKIIDALWVKFQDYGISNLNVLDTSLFYNVSTLGVELLGEISFEDGFVLDVDSFTLDEQSFTWFSLATATMIRGNMFVNNLRLYRDFRADLATGMKVGTVVITSTVSYTLTIEKEHGNDTIVPQITYFTNRNLVWETHPDDMETRMMERQFASQSNQAGNRPSLVPSTAQNWLPLLSEYFEEITRTIDFPDTMLS